MNEIIKSVENDSVVSGLVFPGETVVAINGNIIGDVLDYKFYSYDSRLTLDIKAVDGSRRNVVVEKDDGEDLGLEFVSYLMDKEKACRNRCVFCFIDQLPRGMRRTMYFKDDDVRLSFLTGNYVTLTNLDDKDIERIVQLRISPLNISVHATNPELRAFMLGNPNGALGFKRMKRLADGGISMNCQIVCCPDLNDGAELSHSMSDLESLYPAVNSVSIVPVGLTRHREGLHAIRPHDRTSAAEAIALVNTHGDSCLEKHGSRIFYCADEFYLKAGLALPPEEYYEDYPQLENGVGMLRLLESEFMYRLESTTKFSKPSEVSIDRPEPFAVATGEAAAPFIEHLCTVLESTCGAFDRQIYAIRNDFFGSSIDVAGLVTGGDLIAQLKDRNLYGRLLIPDSMLRSGEEVFLDGVTVNEVKEALNADVIPVSNDDLFDAIFGK